MTRVRPGEMLQNVPFKSAVRATVEDILQVAERNGTSESHPRRGHLSFESPFRVHTTGLLEDNEDFRRDHFYTEPMDDLYRAIEAEARILFNLASGRSRGDYHGYGSIFSAFGTLCGRFLRVVGVLFVCCRRCKYMTWLQFVKTMSNNLIDEKVTLDNARCAFIYSKMDATT